MNKELLKKGIEITIGSLKEQQTYATKRKEHYTEASRKQDSESAAYFVSKEMSSMYQGQEDAYDLAIFLLENTCKQIDEGFYD